MSTTLTDCLQCCRKDCFGRMTMQAPYHCQSMTKFYMVTGLADRSWMNFETGSVTADGMLLANLGAGLGGKCPYNWRLRVGSSAAGWDLFLTGTVWELRSTGLNVQEVMYALPHSQWDCLGPNTLQKQVGPSGAPLTLAVTPWPPWNTLPRTFSIPVASLISPGGTTSGTAFISNPAHCDPLITRAPATIVMTFVPSTPNITGTTVRPCHWLGEVLFLVEGNIRSIRADLSFAIHNILSGIPVGSFLQVGITTNLVLALSASQAGFSFVFDGMSAVTDLSGFNESGGTFIKNSPNAPAPANPPPFLAEQAGVHYSCFWNAPNIVVTAG